MGLMRLMGLMRQMRQPQLLLNNFSSLKTPRNWRAKNKFGASYAQEI
jgi:hypothetical protein